MSASDPLNSTPSDLPYEAKLLHIIDKLPPDAFERLQKIISVHLLPEVLTSFQEKAWVTFRLNPLKIENIAESINHLLQLGLELMELSGFEHTFIIPVAQKRLLTESVMMTSGQIYLQNPASMLAVDALQIMPEIEVLDLAAAPGGKTSLIAVKMQNSGRIAAVEPNRNRFFRLKANLEQQGVQNTQYYMHDGRDIGHKTPERFDRVLIDAPCSSDSTFNIHDPSSIDHWNLKKVKACSKLQQKLIQSAFDALKPDGLMVYSTCAFSPEENEQIVTSFLNKNTNASLIPYFPSKQIQEGFMADKTFQPALNQWQQNPLRAQGTLRVLPNGLYNGFYLAKIHKKI